MHPLDPTAVNVVQDVIVAQLQAGFTRVQAIAWPLLYGFAVLEVVLVGLGVALGRRTVASDLLGHHAAPGAIAREVHRLWQLNRERIGTGDPDLLLVGTRLVLQ